MWTNALNKFRDALPDVVTLPQYFKDYGYHTQSVGKVFCNFCRDPISWSVPEFDQKHSFFHKYALEKPKTDAKGVAAECADVPDEAFPDGKVANAAVEALEAIKDRPFFLGVGFWKTLPVPGKRPLSANALGSTRTATGRPRLCSYPSAQTAGA